MSKDRYPDPPVIACCRRKKLFREALSFLWKHPYECEIGSSHAVIDNLRIDRHGRHIDYMLGGNGSKILTVNIPWRFRWRFRWAVERAAVLQAFLVRFEGLQVVSKKG